MTDKAVLLSIKPKYCELIASGEKTVEVRKTRPKLKTPFKCYIYCTKKYYRSSDGYFQGKCCGKVIGEFVCNEIAKIINGGSCFTIENCTASEINQVARSSCLDFDDMKKYLSKKDGYAWHISDLKIYNKPKTLDDFRKPCISPEMPYCPLCKVGYEYISETDAEFYRVDGECDTEWCCLNCVKKPPQSWCYVEDKQ